MRLLTLLGVALLVGATLAGAGLARSVRIPAQWLHAAAGIVLAVLVLDLLPEIWSAAGLAAMACGYALAKVLGSVSFGSAALGVAVHRLVEGALLALVISPAAIAAFVAHAMAEGFAVGTTLRDAPQRTVASWIAVACGAPVMGALLMPSGWGPLEPMLTAVAAGAIARVAHTCLRPGQPPESSSSAPSGTRSDSRSSSHP
jgi:ZIP family zinc transporter